MAFSFGFQFQVSLYDLNIMCPTTYKDAAAKGLLKQSHIQISFEMCGPYAPLVIDQFDYNFGNLGVKRFGFDGFGCCFRGLINIYCGFLFLNDF